MFAIIESGSKQYKVSVGDRIQVDVLKNIENNDVVFNKVLLIANNDSVQIGMPYLEKATVIGKVLAKKRDKKLIVFRYKPKKRYKKKKGHRQAYMEVEILEIKK